MNDNDNIIKKSFISAILFTVIVVIVFYFIFKDNSYKEVYHSVLDANKLYLLVALLCMSTFSICEALNIKTALNLFKEKISFKRSYKYALAGFFVAGITPSASGGDPMQLYLMSRDDIKISHGALTLLLKLLSFQFNQIVIAVLGFIMYRKIILTSLGNLKYIIFLGAFLNILVGLLYFLIIFFKPIVIYLMELLSKLLHTLHVKKANKIINKLNALVDDYGNASIVIKQNKKVLLKICLTTFVQVILFYSIPYFVYLAFGLRDYTVIRFIALQSVLYISVSSLPFPGAVGVSEATFMRIYKNMYPVTILGSAMVVTRFINFYIFIVYSGISLMYFILKENFKTSYKR